MFFFFFFLILAARVESRIRMFLVGQFQFSRDAQLAEVLFTWFLYLRYFHMCWHVHILKKVEQLRHLHL